MLSVTMAERPRPPSQGQQSSCCASATARVLVDMLRLKYGVVIPREKAFSVLQKVSPWWSSMDVPQLCEDFNDAAPEQSLLEDPAGKCAYSLEIDCHEIPFEAACEVARARAGFACLVVLHGPDNTSLSTMEPDTSKSQDRSGERDIFSDEDEEVHAYAAFEVVDGPDLVCSSGASQDSPYLYLHKEALQFIYELNVTITKVSQAGAARPIPYVSRLYTHKEEKAGLWGKLVAVCEKAEVRLAQLTDSAQQLQMQLSLVREEADRFVPQCRTLSFLRGTGPNTNGKTWKDLISVNSRPKSMQPDDFEWLFPSWKVTNGVDSRQQLDLGLQQLCREDRPLRATMQAALAWYCSQLGLDVQWLSDGQVSIHFKAMHENMQLHTGSMGVVDPWWSSRVSRVLQSMRLFRLYSEAAALMTILEQIASSGPSWSVCLDCWRKSAATVSLQ
eukprot:TRINITY_DN44527_c0_g1_i1.p1 TRINITY_DN44527_c0_g1~~TRINITY_DN44527_c0_g1_i1.p1  ORF type:complete len:445 (-),score=63.15 TRINITY_DN44527_c0_g1_i1:107-1441(-)